MAEEEEDERRSPEMLRIRDTNGTLPIEDQIESSARNHVPCPYLRLLSKWPSCLGRTLFSGVKRQIVSLQSRMPAFGRLTAIRNNRIFEGRGKSIRDVETRGASEATANYVADQREDPRADEDYTKSDDDYNNYNSIIPSLGAGLHGWDVECCEFRKNPIANGKFDFPVRERKGGERGGRAGSRGHNL